MKRFANRPKPGGIKMAVPYKTYVSEFFAVRAFSVRNAFKYFICLFQRGMPVKQYLARQKG